MEARVPRFPMSWRLVILLAIMAVSPFIVGCPPGPTPTPEPAELFFKKITVTKTRANIGDQITFHWEYVHPELLEKQWVEVMSLTIQGQLFRRIEGCSPETPNQECMETDRPEGYSRSLVFEGPVTVVIWAKSRGENGKVINAAFDILLDGGYFKANVAAYRMVDDVLNTTYPRLNLPADGSSRWIEFPVFFGIYEDVGNNPTGREDTLVSQLANVLPQDSAFLGRSYNPNPANAFGFKVGCKFPIMAADYLFNSADAVDQSAGRTFQQMGYVSADAMLVAAKIMYSGNVFKGTDDKGGEVVIQTGGLSFEPVFMQIDLRSEQQGRLHVVDMHVGNIPQGFVASGYWGLTAYRYVAHGGYAAPYSFADSNERYKVGMFHEGYVKASRLGFNAEGRGKYIDVSEVKWDKVPFYSDYQLGGELSIQ